MNSTAELVFAALGEKLIVTWHVLAAAIEPVQVLLVMINDEKFTPAIEAAPSMTFAPELLVKVTVLLMGSLVYNVPKSIVGVAVVKGIMLLNTAKLALSIPVPQFFRVAQS